MNYIFIKRTIISSLIICVAIAVGYFAAGWNLSLNSRIVAKQPATISLAMEANVDPTKLYKVIGVVDGDTFEVRIDEKEITVRLLGINTPETIDPRKLPECYGPEASAKTKSLLNGREVKLVLNPNREKTDKYSRLLAYAYRDDGLFINELLLQEGFAREYTFGKVYQYQSEFKNAEKQAKTAGNGLWTKCNK